MIDGIIPVIKPPGVTSHDIIGILRGVLKTKKIGHSGTLDPMAAGVLLIYTGKATRLIEYGDKNAKTYVAECQFGLSTDTEDITGNILETKDISKDEIDWNKLESKCKSFLGKIMQRPSSYSAIKVDGKRAYDLAREGKLVELPSREIEIYEIELLAYSFPYFTIKVTCSTGTYIRALLRDICESLGTIGTMTALQRTQIDQYTVEDSYTIEEIKELGKENVLQPIENAVSHMPKIDLTTDEAIALCQGKRLSLRNKSLKEGLYRLYDEDLFLGIVEVTATCIRSNKILFFPKLMQ